jgi:predicted ATPase
LHLAAEHEYPVPPLELPDPRRLPEVELLSQCDALTLFVERSQAAKPSFHITGENGQSVAEVCSRLDGLPLAIELAATRIRLFPPQALLARLSDRLSLLTGGAKDAPIRQQTLRNTIAWSYDILFPQDQTLFARLSAFAGGCTFEAADAVCNPDGDLDLLEGLTSLVEKSLLQQEGEDEPRFIMLETIREYAGEKLAERGEAEVLRRQHALRYLALVEQAERELEGQGQVAWLDRLEAELDNLRAALSWTLKAREAELALRLSGGLDEFWLWQGYISEGRRWLDDALALGRDQTLARAQALVAAAHVVWAQDDPERTASLAEEGLALSRSLGYRKGVGRLVHCLGHAAIIRGAFERAKRFYREALQGRISPRLHRGLA